MGEDDEARAYSDFHFTLPGDFSEEPFNAIYSSSPCYPEKKKSFSRVSRNTQTCYLTKAYLLLLLLLFADGAKLFLKLLSKDPIAADYIFPDTFEYCVPNLSAI